MMCLEEMLWLLTFAVGPSMPLPLPQPMVVRMMIMLGFSVCDLAYETLGDTPKQNPRGMKLNAEHLYSLL